MIKFPHKSLLAEENSEYNPVFPGDTQVFQEKRRHRRYRVQEGIYAIVGSNANRMGQILDISLGGLAFTYKKISDLFQEEINDQEKMPDLYIFFDKLDFIKKVPPHLTARLVEEMEIAGAGPYSRRIRCSLEFQQLTFSQKKWLKHFIRQHTIFPV